MGKRHRMSEDKNCVKICFWRVGTSDNGYINSVGQPKYDE